MSATMSDDNVKALRGCTHLCMSSIPDSNVPDHLSAWHAKHAEHLSALRRDVPGMETCAPGEELPRMAQHLSTIRHIQDKIRSTNPHLLSMTAGEQAGAIDAKLDEMATAGKALAERDSTIAELRKQTVDLSARAVKDVPSEAVPFILEGLNSLKTQMKNAGAPPHLVDAYFGRAASADGKVNSVLCSATANPLGTGRALIFDEAELVLEMLKNRVSLGTMTGGQHLSRAVPGNTLHNSEATQKAIEMMQKA